jgi:hypothetical protein
MLMAERKEKEAQKEKQGTSRNEAKKPPRRNTRSDSYDSPTIFFNNYHGSGNSNSGSAQPSLLDHEMVDSARSGLSNQNKGSHVSPLLHAQGLVPLDNKDKKDKKKQYKGGAHSDMQVQGSGNGQNEDQASRNRRGPRQLSSAPSPGMPSADTAAAPSCPFALLQVGLLVSCCCWCAAATNCVLRLVANRVLLLVFESMPA